MSTSDVDDIRGLIRRKAGLSTNDLRITDARILELINESLSAISAERDWPWLEDMDTISTVVDQQIYAFPTDAVMLKNLFMDRGRELRYETPTSFHKASHLTGYPRWYTIIDNNIYIAPVPQKVETITALFSKSEPILTTGTDTPIIPERYINYLITKTAGLVATDIQDYEVKQLLEAEQERWRIMIVNDSDRTRAFPTPFIKRSWARSDY